MLLSPSLKGEYSNFQRNEVGRRSGCVPTSTGGDAPMGASPPVLVETHPSLLADAPYVRARTLARSPWLRTRARGAGRPSDRTTRGVTKGYPRPELCVYYKYTHALQMPRPTAKDVCVCCACATCMLYIHTTYGCAASTNVVDTHVTMFRAYRATHRYALLRKCAAGTRSRRNTNPNFEPRWADSLMGSRLIGKTAGFDSVN